MEKIISPPGLCTHLFRLKSKLPASRRELSRPGNNCWYVENVNKARRYKSHRLTTSHQARYWTTPAEEHGNGRPRILFEVSSHYGQPMVCRWFFCTGYGHEAQQSLSSLLQSTTPYGSSCFVSALFWKIGRYMNWCILPNSADRPWFWLLRRM